jgi:dephospho-CoA kinase
MIIGIAGTLGAGKGTVVKHLIETRGFKHYSARKFILDEIAKRGLATTVRDNMSLVANDLRAAHGSGYIIEQLFAQAQQNGGNAVIESLHTPGEARFLREHGGQIWGVDADIRKRYERIVKRESETDHVSFEKFVEDNHREIASVDPTKHNIRKVIEMADKVFYNDGTQEELRAQVMKAL